MNFIAYDLGTGGIKASLLDENLCMLSSTFMEYPTMYTNDIYHEQKPLDWWKAVCATTKQLFLKTGSTAKDILSIAISGHSLVCVPLDKNNKLLLDSVPIWSDTRAKKQAESFFCTVDEKEWYNTTCNGFPHACYPLFKLMHLKSHNPDIYAKIDCVLGSKDFINFKLTGKKATDFSYASGLGAYDLQNNCINKKYLNVAGIKESIIPNIYASHHVIGEVSKEASLESGLEIGTPVACGGVDNACMALGAVGAKEGKIYTSLGSSAWVAVNCRDFVHDFKTKPYTFAHIEPGMYTSAYSIFAGGSSLKWAMNELCKDWADRPDKFELLTKSVKNSPIGSNGIFFNPSLAGGTSQDKSPYIRGSFIGLSLANTREDIMHAVMEGIALNLKNSVTLLSKQTKVEDTIQFCGGGSKNPYWMQMFADIFNMNIFKTNIDQNAATLGAAAIAARAIKHIDNYDCIYSLHKTEYIKLPNVKNSKIYKNLSQDFNVISETLANLADTLHQNNV